MAVGHAAPYTGSSTGRDVPRIWARPSARRRGRQARAGAPARTVVCPRKRKAPQTGAFRLSALACCWSSYLPASCDQLSPVSSNGTRHRRRTGIDDDASRERPGACRRSYPHGRPGDGSGNDCTGTSVILYFGHTPTQRGGNLLWREPSLRFHFCGLLVWRGYTRRVREPAGPQEPEQGLEARYSC
jgi:hypothetical protein